MFKVKNVAAYCRVSTKSEIQSNSLDLQISHYTEYIKKHPQTNEFFTEFDPYAFASLVDHITAYNDGRLVFTFRDGKEINY